MDARNLMGKYLARAIAITCAFASSACMVVVGSDSPEGHSYATLGSNFTQGNDQIATEKRAIRDFTRLSVKGPLQVEVNVGFTPRMEVIADANLIELVHSETTDSLHKVWIAGSFRSKNPIRIVYTVTQLDEAISLGSARLTITGIQGNALKIDNQGSGSISLAGRVARLDVNTSGSGEIDAKALGSKDIKARVQGSGSLELNATVGNSLELDLLGSGSARATGDVANLLVRLQGSGSVDCAALKSQVADLHLIGSGDLTATVSQSVMVQSQGSGKVRVLGAPSQKPASGDKRSSTL